MFAQWERAGPARLGRRGEEAWVRGRKGAGAYGIVTQPDGTVPFIPLRFRLLPAAALRPRSEHFDLRGLVEAFISVGFPPLFRSPLRSPEPHSLLGSIYMGIAQIYRVMDPHECRNCWFFSNLQIGSPVASVSGVFRGPPLPAETQLKCILEPGWHRIVALVGLQDSFSSDFGISPVP